MWWGSNWDKRWSSATIHVKLQTYLCLWQQGHRVMWFHNMKFQILKWQLKIDILRIIKMFSHFSLLTRWSVHGCPVDGTVLTFMFSRAVMVLWASSNSELSWDTRFRRYFLSLLRLSDCTHTHITQKHKIGWHLHQNSLWVVNAASQVWDKIPLLSFCLWLPHHISMLYLSPLYEGVHPAGYWPVWSQCGSPEGCNNTKRRLLF